MTDISTTSSTTSSGRRSWRWRMRRSLAVRMGRSVEGGVVALAKPAAGIGEGPMVVRREVAAWLFARELGLADMVACTVLRDDVPLADGSRGAASVQIIWAPPLTPDSAGPFPDDDRWRAAIFDAVIAHSDRGHNWLGVPDAGGQER